MSQFKPVAANQARRLVLILLLSIFIVDLGTTTLSLTLRPLGLTAGLVAVIDAIILTTILFPVLYFVVFRPMGRHIRQLEQAKTALRATHDQLELRVRERTLELEQRNREIGLLAGLGDFLPACTRAEEAYGAISRTGQQLFPDTMGVLFVYSASRNELESLAGWGEPALNPNERIFVPEECWALRRGRAYRVENPLSDPSCQHVPPTLSGRYMCVPMIAQGEVLGVLHLRDHRPAAASAESVAPLNEKLIVSLAEYTALALINLRLLETLRNQSIRDPLTGLFNRRYMEETLEREMQRAKRRQGPLCVVMLDLDNFKRFNDTYGHSAGDLLLREVGALMKTQIRGSDIACRYGGEEFTIILPEAPRDIAQQRIEALRLGIRQLNVQHRRQSLGTITVSAGIAVFPEDGAAGETLLHAADQALYRAKAEGRDRVVVGGTPAASSPDNRLAPESS